MRNNIDPEKKLLSLDKENKRQKMVSLFLIFVSIIIIWLLFQRFSTSFIPHGDQSTQGTTGNIDIFEIKCDQNCTCSDDNKSNQISDTLNYDTSLNDIFISAGILKFNKDITNYNILLENNVDKITINAIKNNEKSTLYYIYNKKIYSDFIDMPIFIGQNVITIVVIAENGNMTSYRLLIHRLNSSDEVVTPVSKDTNPHLSNIIISNGKLLFEKNKINYTVLIDNQIDYITLNATTESEKSSLYYLYNGKKYDEFKDIKVSSGVHIVTILVIAEDGSSMSYTVTIKKYFQLDSLGGLDWYSTNNLNIFSNPVYKGEAIIAPGFFNSYEFIINNKVNKKVKYSITFHEKSDYVINMKYRLKRNGNYILGNDSTWVSASELNVSEIQVDSNHADDYILDWKWFDGENDNLIGKLQNDYTLSITLSAIIQE